MKNLMESIPLEAAGGDMTNFNPATMIAISAMGNWGPHGSKFNEDEYLNENFNYTSIRPIR